MNTRMLSNLGEMNKFLKKSISRLKHEEIKIYIYMRRPIKNEGIESIMQNISAKKSPGRD